MRALIAGLLLLVSVLAPAGTAQGHALQPGFLSLERLEATFWRVFWRKPDVRGQPMRMDARLPENCAPRTAPAPRFDGGGWVATWVARCPGGLEGGEIAIPGLEATKTDVLVRYELEAGEGVSLRLTPDEPAGIVPARPSAWEVLTSYVGLGFEHILEGWDHLLFVFALMLLIRDRWRLIGAVTAFTVAHSFTLAAATLGWVAFPPQSVEAVIALSIMFLASELALRRPGEVRLSERFPWLVTFTFGLLHGFGFAGALKEIGMPRDEAPLALLAFNIGVESGQLAFIGTVSFVMIASGRVARNRLLALARRPTTVCPYAIGGVSAFWFIERVASF